VQVDAVHVLQELPDELRYFPSLFELNTDIILCVFSEPH